MRPCQPGCQRAEHGDSQKGDFGFGQHLGVSCNEVRVSSPMQETRSHAISFTEFTARCSNGGNGWLSGGGGEGSSSKGRIMLVRIWRE